MSGLARVTSYNKLAEKIDDDEDDSYSEPASSRMDSQGQYMQGVHGDEDKYGEDSGMKN